MLNIARRVSRVSWNFLLLVQKCRNTVSINTSIVEFCGSISQKKKSVFFLSDLALAPS